MIDLLSTLNESVKSENMAVVEEKNGSTRVKGLNVQIANNEEEALNLLFEGETNRSISEHQMNKGSTRSHCIFTIYVESRSRVESSERVLTSKLNLVDLAGSERISKTETKGVTLKEAMYINRSLTYLEQVIIALADKKRDHVPFRQSKMTHVLRDSLGGNCNTLMIANIWGEREHIEETISTLRFATRMMCVMLDPEVNVQYDPLALIKKYEREVKELKQELSMYDTLSNRSHVHYEPYTELQKADLTKQIKSFLENDGEELEIINIRQIRESFNIFKTLWRTALSSVEDNTSRKISPVRDSTNDVDTTKSKLPIMELEKEDGVGDMEGSGFGIGLAPVIHRQAKLGGRLSQPTASIAKKSRGPSRLASVEHDEDDALDSDIKRFESGYVIDQTANSSETRNKKGVMSRAEEFEIFKKTKGAEMNKLLNENKGTQINLGIYKAKKKTAKDLAEEINKVKAQMDQVKAELDTLKKYRLDDGQNVVINEKEVSLIASLKGLKLSYKNMYDNLKTTRQEIDYCARVTDQCRQRNMTEFEHWFESRYGTVEEKVFFLIVGSIRYW